MTLTTDAAHDALDAELQAFFGQDPSQMADPYPLYARLRAQGPLYRHEPGPATLVTSYDAVRTVMGGSLPVSNNGWRHGEHADGVLARLPRHQLHLAESVLDFESTWLSRRDGADHTRLRRIASRAFTARRIAELRGQIQARTDELLDALAAHDEPDLKTQVADRLPLMVICDMLGVPLADRPMIWRWAVAISEHFSLTEHSLDEAVGAIDAFRDYVLAMVRRLRETGDGPDLAVQLLAGGEREGLTSEELVAMYLLLLFGGTETTTNLLGSGFWNLHRGRRQWGDLVDEPGLVSQAVEEMLRFDPSVHYLPRYAVAEFELEGRLIRPGESLLTMIAAANRDPDVFEDPDVFDIRRSNASAHLSLAFGPHFCLGAALARLEGEIFFSSLIARFPDIELATDTVQFTGSAMQRTITGLPVALGADRERRG